MKVARGCVCFSKMIIHDVRNFFVTKNYCFFPMSNLVLEFKALSDKKGFIVFQDGMLSDTFLLFRLLNYSHITFGNRFTAKIPLFL